MDYSNSDESDPSRIKDRHLDRKREAGGKVSVPGAIISGGVNAGLIALILAVPGFGLPFIGPAFSSIIPALMAGPAANIISTFMRMGYSNHTTRKLGKIVENSASAWGFWSLWQYYPFNFAAVGAPSALDNWLPYVFAVFAALSGLSVVGHIIGLIRGPKPQKNAKRIEDETDELEE